MAFVEHKAPGELLSPSRERQRITKLSEAMREGAKLRGQCIGAFWREDRSCALGAAFESVFGKPSVLKPGAAYGFFPVEDDRIMFDRYFGITKELSIRVYRRNDDGMPREEIADWLESQGL